MAKYELPIYGKDDEVVKTYKTNVVPWSIYVKSAEMAETIKSKPISEQINSIGEIIKEIFVDLTDDELARADSLDVVSTFRQVVSGGKSIVSGTNEEKNA